MKYIIGWTLAYIFYCLGDLGFRFLDKYIELGEHLGALEDEDDVVDILYKIYSNLMGLSLRINDWAGIDLWKVPNI